ncbi:MAG: ComF family protein [Clostridiales bacterium]|nr:ComF family protein [Clostridiales bacterium]MDD7036160.1 ComF family protein [Bacillota bacterium]MDY2921180.1 ComF family protein [Lentihominibacter sp.]
MGRIRDEIWEALFPSNIYCIVCGSLIDRSRPYSLCDRCAAEIHWITDGRTCRRCGKALPDTYRGELCYSCMSIDHAFSKGFSCMTYGLHEREIMMDIKYSGKGYMAVKMGEVMADKFMSSVMKEEVLPDVAVPVPVSRERMKERGYNQSELMARSMSRALRKEGVELRVDTGILERARDTGKLRSMNPAERRLALAEAFRVPRGKEEKISGKCLLLIDDILTTGATADACSRCLLEAGAGRVYFMSLASGGNVK